MLGLKPVKIKNPRVSIMLAAEEIAEAYGMPPEDVLSQFRGKEEYVFLVIAGLVRSGRLEPRIMATPFFQL